MLILRILRDQSSVALVAAHGQRLVERERVRYDRVVQERRVERALVNDCLFTNAGVSVL